MPFPGFDHFYSVDDPVASRPFRGGFPPHERAFELARAEAIASRPIRVDWAMGAAVPGDVIWTTAVFPLIVHARVVELLSTNRFTGWTTYPVEVHSKSADLMEDFHGLAITGRCGRVDLTHSTIVLREFPGGWIPHFLGRFFVPDTWDGSDLFMESVDSNGKSSSYLFVTQPVCTVLRRAGVKNLMFTRLSEVCVSTSVYTIGLQHLLPTDFEARVTDAYREAGVPRPPFV